VQSIADFAEQLAREAGELIRHERENNTLRTDYKDQTELVTHADLMADKLITDAIRKQYPDHRILSEESSPDRNLASDLDSPLWIIDPIDGTVNYAYGQPQVAISIAYADQGRVQLGVVHAPFVNETFRAIHGGGAALNGQAIECSKATVPRDSLFATGFPYTKDHLEPILKRLNTMLRHCRDLRRVGSAALDICWVACGRLDAYYESVKPWDFAAARLIALEAGARAGHFSGVPEGQPADTWGQDILISTPGIYDEMHKLLQLAAE
jgi:myo-inositol-1(or 4)-monophosphatase